jgi:hypothetical protein
LLYRGSDHGWKALDFHSRCDNKGPTISLFKIKDGDCIGGYTNAQWSSDERIKHVADSEAMLFNLSCKRHFPNKRTGSEIRCFESYGPYFGDRDLTALCNPFNGYENCLSRGNKSGYAIAV